MYSWHLRPSDHRIRIRPDHTTPLTGVAFNSRGDLSSACLPACLSLSLSVALPLLPVCRHALSSFPCLLTHHPPERKNGQTARWMCVRVCYGRCISLVHAWCGVRRVWRVWCRAGWTAPV